MSRFFQQLWVSEQRDPCEIAQKHGLSWAFADYICDMVSSCLDPMIKKNGAWALRRSSPCRAHTRVCILLIYTTFTNFSMKYLVMCKVYTNVGVKK